MDKKFNIFSEDSQIGANESMKLSQAEVMTADKSQLKYYMFFKF